MTYRIRALSVVGAIAILSSSAAAQTPATPAPPLVPAQTATPAPTVEPAPGAPPAALAPVVLEAELPPTPVALEAEPEEAPAKVGYEKGFFIESGDGNHRLAIAARLQARYTYHEVEAGPDTSAFSIERARLKLEGHAFTKDLTYVFQSDFGKGAVTLKDYYGDYRIAPDLLHVRAGQWKRPFSRQQIASSGSQELVDRAITDSAFGAGRDIGIALHNNYEKSPAFEYALGLFNGTGDRASTSISVETDPDTGEVSATAGNPSNVPSMFNPALVGRVGYNHGGIKGYSEADLEGGGLRFSVGASGQLNFDADRSDDSRVRAELDTIVKAHGFSTTGGVYVSSEQAGAGFSDRALGAIGFHLQAGYVIAEQFQPAARVAIVAPDGDENDTLELALGFGYLPFGHNVKWQTEIAALSFQASETTDARIRTQLQLAF